jgi:hypothetical protein
MKTGRNVGCVIERAFIGVKKRGLTLKGVDPRSAIEIEKALFSANSAQS